jgi:acyl dehydratase
MPSYAYEDFTPGRIFDLGTTTVDPDEMIAFARRFDPQPLHLDPDAAARSVLGGLCASGWYTACLWMRQWVDHVLTGSTSQGSPGGSELSWPVPSFPGDVLTASCEVLGSRLSRRRPTLGLVDVRALLLRGDDVVFRSTFVAMFATRE